MKIKKEVSLIDVITICVTVLLACYTLNQDSRISDVERFSKCNEFKPIIDIVGAPLSYVKRPYFNLSDESVNGFIEDSSFSANFPCKEYITITNRGNEKARIIGKFISTLQTTSDTIHDIMLYSKKLRDNFVLLQHKDVFDCVLELFPGDTVRIESPLFGQVIDSNQEKLIRHYLIIYENDFMCVFDTYFRYIYDIDQPFYEVFKKGNSGGIVMKSDAKSLFQIKERPSKTTKIYSKKESKKIREQLLEQ